MRSKMGFSVLHRHLSRWISYDTDKKSRFFLLEINLNDSVLKENSGLHDDLKSAFTEQTKSKRFRENVIYAAVKATKDPLVLFECPNQVVPYDFMMEVLLQVDV